MIFKQLLKGLIETLDEKTCERVYHLIQGVLGRES